MDIDNINNEMQAMSLEQLHQDRSMVDNEISSTSLNEISEISHSSFPGAIQPQQKGHCVKEYEEQMDNLKKENFNLKYKIWFLEEKLKPEQRGNLAQEEMFYRENIELKEEIEGLNKILSEKQDLLCQASKAIELLDEQQKNQYDKSQSTIDTLNEKVELLTKEVHNLKSKAGRPSGVNDTGFAEFLGAVEHRENQRSTELEEHNKKLIVQIAELESAIKKLSSEKQANAKEILELKYENTENLEKLKALENSLKDSMKDNQLSQAKDELYQTKVKYADAVCELDDMETKFKEKCEEHSKAVFIIKELLEKIRDGKTDDISSMEKTSFQDNTTSASNQSKSLLNNMQQQIEYLTKQKDEEIDKLKEELRKRTQNLQGLVNKELWEKNREIEKLSLVINKLKDQQRAQQRTADDSFVFLQDASISNSFTSFNELKYNEMLELNKKAQSKINSLVQKLCSNHEKVTKHDVEQLQTELKELNEQHEKCEQARKGILEICNVLVDRLDELNSFLASILQDTNILNKIGDERGIDLKKMLERSLDLSRSLNISRLSLPGDQSLIHLENLSALGLLDGSFVSLKENTDNVSLIANLRTEIEQLKKQLEENRRFSDSLEGENSRKNEIDELHERLKAKDNLLCEKNEVMMKAQEKLLQFQEETQGNLENLKEKLFYTTEERNTYKKFKEDLENDIEEYKTKLEGFESELLDKSNELFHVKEEKESLNQELKIISEKFDYMEKEYSATVTELNEKLEILKEFEENLEKLSHELQDSVPQEEYEKLNAQLKRQQDRMAKDQEQIIYMQTEITKMQQQLKEAGINLKSAQESYDRNLKVISNERDVILGEKLELREKFIHLQEELDNVKFERNELELKVLEFEEMKSVDGASGFEKSSVTEDKENVQSRMEKPLLKTLEISDDRKSKLLSNSSNVDSLISEINPNCDSCVRLETEVQSMHKKMVNLESTLKKAMYKLSLYNKQKMEMEHSVKKEILKTKDVLQNVRSNMENNLNCRLKGDRK